MQNRWQIECSRLIVDVLFFNLILHVFKYCCFQHIVWNFCSQLSYSRLYLISSINIIEKYNEMFCVNRKNLSNFTKWRLQNEINDIQISVIKSKNCYFRKIDIFFETVLVSIWYICFINFVSLIMFIFKSFVYHVKYFKINSKICIVFVKIINTVLMRL